MHLIFANFFTGLLVLDNWLKWGEVALVLGAVIFVHELGHFLVAKLCGVKCEKFYIGFDIRGWKLFHFQWGETEYGIGALPLGGYVKMLGQDDNPAKAAEEIERAKAQAVAEGKSPDDAEVVFDPRSYQAQSVPERMAIISAGVIMNVIFAFVLATWAYGIGVEYQPCFIGSISPGEAAWQAGLRPGDEVLQIGNDDRIIENKHLKYSEIQSSVVASTEEGVRLRIRRPNVAEPFWVTAKPVASTVKIAGAPMIGVGSSMTSELNEKHPTAKFSAAAELNQFKGGDRIVRVADVAVSNYADVASQFAQHPNEPLKVEVERPAKTDPNKTTANREPAPQPEPEKLTITIPKVPLRDLGIAFEMGEITNIENDSPAAKAGLRIGDVLTKIDQKPIDVDPLLLPELLRRRAVEGKTEVQLTVRRSTDKDKSAEVDLNAALRIPTWNETPWLPFSPVSIPSLGVAYRVNNRVQSIDPNGPAGKIKEAKNQIAPGDDVVAVQFLVGDKYRDEPEIEAPTKEILLDDGKTNWPSIHQMLQRVPADVPLKITFNHYLSDKKVEKRTVELTAVDSSEFNNSYRGLVFEPFTRIHTAESFGEAAQLGLRETGQHLKRFYAFLRNIFTGRVSFTNLGGLPTIIDQAGKHAEAGFVTLLMFLVMFNASLAVINFLPIPILDGGHMVFLLYEGITGKRPNEKVMTILLFIGLVLILGLMILTIGLDINRYLL